MCLASHSISAGELWNFLTLFNSREPPVVRRSPINCMNYQLISASFYPTTSPKKCAFCPLVASSIAGLPLFINHCVICYVAKHLSNGSTTHTNCKPLEKCLFIGYSKPTKALNLQLKCLSQGVIKVPCSVLTLCWCKSESETFRFYHPLRQSQNVFFCSFAFVTVHGKNVL